MNYRVREALKLAAGPFLFFVVVIAMFAPVLFAGWLTGLLLGADSFVLGAVLGYVFWLPLGIFLARLVLDDLNAKMYGILVATIGILPYVYGFFYGAGSPEFVS